MFEQPVKCVIWDLDETVWDGSLAERDDIQPRPMVLELIKALDAKGIVNSVCSKNSFGQAKQRLEELGVWDYLVFPVIDFVPKGPNIKTIVDNMQLRAPNILFVDDNPGNRNEAEYYCEGIMVADPNDPDFLPSMQRYVAQADGKSRLERYKILEQKHQAKQHYQDNTSFLRDSKITVCILRNPTDLPFKDRIAELANRTNQLNFTHSRFPTPEDAEDYFSGTRSLTIHHGAVFVYDAYGDYGLVGFYAFDESQRPLCLDHFYFSCRIMNMGVEQCVYQHLRDNHGLQPFDPMEERLGMDTSFIRVIHELDDHLTDYVENHLDAPESYATAIIAGCTSGVIAHYLPADLRPARFDLFRLADDEPVNDVETIIYAIYQDYINSYWRSVGGFSKRRFTKYLRRFLDRQTDQQVFLLLASEKAYPSPPPEGASLLQRMYHWTRPLRKWYLGRHVGRARTCNAIVREVLRSYPNVTCVEMGDLVQSANEQTDPRHFSRVVIQRACDFITTRFDCAATPS